MFDVYLEQFLDMLTELNTLAVNTVNPLGDIGPMATKVSELNKILGEFGYQLVDFPAKQCFVPVKNTVVQR